MNDIAALKAAALKASPGDWTIWAETTPSKGEAVAELAHQVMSVPDQDFAGAVYMLNADGKCPALTGCGPTSKANAGYIKAAQPKAILSLIASHEAIVEALRGLVDHVERNECEHEDTSRGGFIWTICNECGKKWADDKGGFQPYSPPPALSRARAALSAIEKGEEA
jgi:hypothetical protein